MDECDFNVTVVGLGLIGASYALALRKLKINNIWGIDVDEEVLNKAESKGIINKGFLSGEEALKNSDLVIIAVYPKETINFIKKNVNNFKPGAIITDVAGLKSDIVKQTQVILPIGVEFIGGHPMAGREGKGIDMASAEIFTGANYILTTVEGNDADKVELLSSIVYKLGCKKVIKIDPEEHDKIIAYSSQLPHILAITLINSGDCAEIASFVGGGFKDLTRIAINNASLWTELLLENKKDLVETIECFQKEVEGIKQGIINNDYSFIYEEFEKANKKRREII